MYDEDHLVLRLSRKDSTSHSYRGTNARSRSVAIIYFCCHCYNMMTCIVRLGKFNNSFICVTKHLTN